MQANAIKPRSNVIIVDDLIATGEKSQSKHLSHDFSTFYSTVQVDPRKPRGSWFRGWEARLSNTCLSLACLSSKAQTS